MVKEKLVFWILTATMIAVLIGQGFDFWRGGKEQQELARPSGARLKQPAEEEKPSVPDLSGLKRKEPFARYAELLKRDMFRAATPEESQAEVIETPVEKVEEKIHYAFQGLAQVGATASAIVKNKDTGQVYFVKAGHKLGEYLVESIYEDMVVLRKGEDTLVLER